MTTPFIARLRIMNSPHVTRMSRERPTKASPSRRSRHIVVGSSRRARCSPSMAALVTHMTTNDAAWARNGAAYPSARSNPPSGPLARLTAASRPWLFATACASSSRRSYRSASTPPGRNPITPPSACAAATVPATAGEPVTANVSSGIAKHPRPSPSCWAVSPPSHRR